jgi:hypothetical protein
MFHAVRKFPLLVADAAALLAVLSLERPHPGFLLLVPVGSAGRLDDRHRQQGIGEKWTTEFISR